MSTEKPNLPFIITDQHQADHLGAYGKKVSQTPHCRLMPIAAPMLEHARLLQSVGG